MGKPFCEFSAFSWLQVTEYFKQHLARPVIIFPNYASNRYKWINQYGCWYVEYYRVDLMPSRWKELKETFYRSVPITYVILLHKFRIFKPRNCFLSFTKLFGCIKRCSSERFGMPKKLKQKWRRGTLSGKNGDFFAKFKHLYDKRNRIKLISNFSFFSLVS